MKERTKGKLLIGLYTLVTGLDLLFTYLGTPNLEREANPLVSRLGLGWPALIVSNLLVLTLYCGLVWYAFAVYQRPVYFAKNITHYIDQLEKRGRSYPFIAALGYAMGYAMLLGRLLPVMEWGFDLAGYDLLWYQWLKRSVPGARPDLWLTFILAVFFVLFWHVREYRANQRAYGKFRQVREDEFHRKRREDI